MNILFLQGPNLNLLGIKSVTTKSKLTLDKLNKAVKDESKKLDINLKTLQTHKEFQAIKNQSPSFIIDLKNGIKTAAIYALLVASFSFIYYKWVDDYAMIKKEQLINMTIDEDQMLEIAKKQIERNPDFYRGKSPEDLIDMQQENINANMNPSVIFPFILFTQLLVGMIYTFLIMALNRLLLAKL